MVFWCGHPARSMPDIGISWDGSGKLRALDFQMKLRFRGLGEYSEDSGNPWCRRLNEVCCQAAPCTDCGSLASSTG